MKIYAVDDEYLALDALEEAILEVVPNAQLRCFNMSKNLLSAAKDDCPDVVFLDIEMPGTNGLQLAQELLKIKNTINIIFTTGYSQYALDALKLYASGYVMKPISVDNIRKELNNLRFPVNENHKADVITFGNFSIFMNHKAVNIRLSKSKELLALTICHAGNIISRKEACKIIFQDEEFSRNSQKSLSRVVSWLIEDLEKEDLTFFKKSDEGYYIDKRDINCDYFDYLNGKKELYRGQFMNQYEWAKDIINR